MAIRGKRSVYLRRRVLAVALSLELAINRLTGLVIAQRRRYAMGVFEDKLKQARNVRAELEARAAADFDKVIARGEEIDKIREAATTAHLVKLDETATSLRNFHASIDDYANGAPPLEDGGKTEDDGSGDKLPKAWQPPVKN